MPMFSTISNNPVCERCYPTLARDMFNYCGQQIQDLNNNFYKANGRIGQLENDVRYLMGDNKILKEENDKLKKAFVKLNRNPLHANLESNPNYPLLITLEGNND